MKISSEIGVQHLLSVKMDFRLKGDKRSHLRNKLVQAALKGGVKKVDDYPGAFEGNNVSAADLEMSISHVLRALSEHRGPGRLSCLHLFVMPGDAVTCGSDEEAQIQAAIAALEGVGASMS